MAGKLTTGLTESNGTLLPGITESRHMWLSACGAGLALDAALSSEYEFFCCCVQDDSHVSEINNQYMMHNVAYQSDVLSTCVCVCVCGRHTLVQCWCLSTHTPLYVICTTLTSLRPTAMSTSMNYHLTCNSTAVVCNAICRLYDGNNRTS